MAAKKKTARKTTSRARKPAARKTTTRRPAAKTTPSVKLTTAEKPRTKSEVFGILGEVLKKDLSKRGPGALNLAGMMKITVQRKPATKARKGINPFTGEMTTFKAKPARNVVKVRPMKALKDLV